MTDIDTKFYHKEMPNDALGDSLVGSMLARQELIDDAMEFMDDYAEDFKALAKTEEQERMPLSLWQAISGAWAQELCDQRDIIAAEIEALRDWLLPADDAEPDEPPGYGLGNEPPDFCANWSRWDERQLLRTILTEQARIAREGE